MQHRRVYIDDWCLMEKICLVTGVLRFGENSWSSVCDLIKPKLQENRPWDWFTPDTCEAQYKVLLNEFVKVQTSAENSALQIIKQLKTKCKLETLHKDEHWNKYLTLKKKLENLLKNDIEVDLIEKYYEEVQQEKKEKEEKLFKHQELLKERENLKCEYEKVNATKTPQKSETKTDGSSSPIVTSPLLSSLLNNPPAVQYRPTLSTTSFVANKSSQGTSRSSSYDKSQTFTDTSYKESFGQELADQSMRILERPTTTGNGSTLIARRLDFPDDDSSSVTDSRIPITDSNNEVLISTETPKSDSQNIENIALISPNEEVYLPEVDIPPETILEVIGDLKEGTISLDKLIRDLEATEETVIIDKEEMQTVTVPLDESFLTKHTESPLPESKNESIEKEIKSVEENVENTINDIEEQVEVIVNSDKDKTEIDMEVDDIKYVEIGSDNNSEPSRNEEPTISTDSFSSTVAIDVELEPSFSEQKSNNEVIEAKFMDKEIEEDDGKKNSKPVVVIKRIEEGSSHAKQRRSRKIMIEESVTEENESLEENSCIKEEQKIDSNISIENEAEKNKPENLIETVEITSENVEEKEPAQVENVCKLANAEDSDSDKFEDALQSQMEEVAEIQISKDDDETDKSKVLTETIEATEKDEKVEDKEHPIEEISHKVELPVEIPISAENEITEKVETIEVESIVSENVEVISEKETPLENKELKEKKSEEVKPGPTKIIKKYGRKRKSICESNEGISEISIKIPPVVLQEIETLDSDIEQTFTSVKEIKTEPCETKTDDQMNQPKEAIQDRLVKEVIAANIKVEKRDTKTPERSVIKVLRRSSGKSQNTLRKNEETKTKAMDNAELIKTRKKSIMLAYSELMSHKYSHAFQKPITNRQVPGYENVIYKPMDLYTIKKKIENRQISTVAEFQRDVLLMLNNAKMFNRINSQVYNMAVEVEDHALPHIQLTVQTLGEGILRRVEETNEKIRKRQSLDNSRKDVKLLKRIKSSTKDDSFSGVPLKKPKLEENEDDRGQLN